MKDKVAELYKERIKLKLSMAIGLLHEVSSGDHNLLLTRNAFKKLEDNDKKVKEILDKEEK